MQVAVSAIVVAEESHGLPMLDGASSDRVLRLGGSLAHGRIGGARVESRSARVGRAGRTFALGHRGKHRIDALGKRAAHRLRVLAGCLPDRLLAAELGLAEHRRLAGSRDDGQVRKECAAGAFRSRAAVAEIVERSCRAVVLRGHDEADEVVTGLHPRR
jgi:hypothetical protein